MPLSSKQKWRKVLKNIPRSQNLCGLTACDSNQMLAVKFPRKERRVEFDKKIVAVLIPTKDEYIEHKLQNELWYNKDEMKNMQLDAISSLNSFVQCNGM